ncbi:putative ribonuclease H-like domain-containing protein [Tanacetum coccineum]
MQDELLQFKLQKVWTLVDLPNGKRAIGTKWVYRNKKDERGIMIKNKARLVAQGYIQEEGIDYDEMDVKSAFLYDDIIFGSTKKSLCTEFEKMMQNKFQISSMGELTFFLGLQTTSTPMETQKPWLKDEDGEEVDVHLYRSMIGSLMYLTSSIPDIMFIYQRFTFNLVAYTDSDYARASLDRKSTIGGCQFLGCRLISWQCKKQTVVANSTTEAEYVAASSCCGQVLWIQNQLLDYGHNLLLLLKVNARRHNLLLLWKVNAGRHNLLLLLKVNAGRHNLLLLLKVNAGRHKRTTTVES